MLETNTRYGYRQWRRWALAFYAAGWASGQSYNCSIMLFTEGYMHGNFTQQGEREYQVS